MLEAQHPPSWFIKAWNFIFSVLESKHRFPWHCPGCTDSALLWFWHRIWRCTGGCALTSFFFKHLSNTWRNELHGSGMKVDLKRKRSHQEVGNCHRTWRASELLKHLKFGLCLLYVKWTVWLHTGHRSDPFKLNLNLEDVASANKFALIKLNRSHFLPSVGFIHSL